MLPIATLIALLLLASACRPAPPSAQAPTPTPTASRLRVVLTTVDVDRYLAVRNRSLTRLEEALREAERGERGALERIVEISLADRQAAAGLGVDPARFVAVRDEIARLMSLQRRREDARTLALELSRARDDLTDQLRVARDAAARQFIEAQVRALEREIAALEDEGKPSAEDEAQLELLAGVRAEIAVQQGRLDRLQRRLKELLSRVREEERERASPSAPTPGAGEAS